MIEFHHGERCTSISQLNVISGENFLNDPTSRPPWHSSESRKRCCLSAIPQMYIEVGFLAPLREIFPGLTALELPGDVVLHCLRIVMWCVANKADNFDG